MKGFKRLLAVMVAGAMLLTLMPTVVLAVEDTISGTFSVNNPPSVTAVTCTPASMTPQASQTVTVSVSDADGKTDLTTLELRIYYDSDGGAPTDGEAEGQSADTQNCVIITWTQSGDSFAMQPDPASNTWDLGSCTSPGSLPGDFTFVFTPGKVATETTGAAVWQLWAKVTDDVTQTDTNYDATAPTVVWYGEVTVGAASVDFGSMATGTDFGSSTRQSVPSVTYITNGAYDEKVKSSDNWTGGTYTAILDYDTGSGTYDPPCDQQDEFALKADNSVTLPGTALGVVDITGVTINDTGTQTGESGEEVTTNNLWLKVGSTFNVDTYTGTIYYIIADGA